MSKFLYPFLASLVALTSCAQLKLLTEKPSAEAAPSKVEAAPSPDVLALPEPKRPPSELTEELMFALLAGEIAGQEQKYQESVRFYVMAALNSNDWAVAKRATQIALFSGQLNEASIAARRWYALVPEDPSAQKTMALIELRMNHPEASAKIFKELLQQAGLPLEKAVPSIAVLLIQETNASGALQVMDEIANAYPTLPEAWFAYGQLAAAKNDVETALTAAGKAVELKPKWPAAQAFYGEMLIRNNRLEEGLAYLEKQNKQYPKDSLVGLTYGRALLKAEQMPEAKKQFERLEKNDPENADVLFALALLYIGENDIASAKLYLERLLSTSQYPDEANFYLGRIAQQEKRYDEALQFLANVHGGKYVWEAQLATVQVLVDSGQSDQARQLLQYLRGQYPDMAMELNVREGELLFSIQRYQEAYDFYTASLKSASQTIDLLYGRSLVSEKMNRLDLAEQDLREILRQDPKNAHALNALGYTLADRTDRYQEALALIQQAYALLPNDPAILDSMGWVKFRLGDLTDAEKHLRKAYTLSQDAEIASHLGEVLWKLREYEEARTIWQEGLQKDPANKRIQGFLQQVVPAE